MIAKNKYQSLQQPNEWLLTTNVNPMNKQINHFEKRNINAEEKNKWMSPQNRHDH